MLCATTKRIPLLNISKLSSFKKRVYYTKLVTSLITKGIKMPYLITKGNTRTSNKTPSVNFVSIKQDNRAQGDKTRLKILFTAFPVV